MLDTKPCGLWLLKTIEVGIKGIKGVKGIKNIKSDSVLGSVESVCREAGWALRLKLGQVQIPSGPHTVLRTTYAFESPRAECFNEN